MRETVAFIRDSTEDVKKIPIISIIKYISIYARMQKAARSII